MIKDDYHDLVVQALIKDGWEIVKEQALMTTGTRRLFVDIRAIKRDGIGSALFEVKGFASPVNALAEALGQYLLYQFAISSAGLDLPLFLAVPSSAYGGILTEQIGQYAREIAKMKLLIFDAGSGSILKWIS